MKSTMEPEQIDFFQKSVRQRMSPFPNYMSMESISKEMADVLGTAYEYYVKLNTMSSLEHS